MCQQVVSNEDGLRVLHVGTSRHDGVSRTLGLAEEGASNVENSPGQVTRLLTQVHADKGRDLIITRATRTQFAAQSRSGTVDETALERRVNVLIVGARHESSGRNVSIEPGEGIVHVRALLVGQKADAVQLVSVRVRPGDVDVGETQIEMG